jgi:hypothetical protein
MRGEATGQWPLAARRARGLGLGPAGDFVAPLMLHTDVRMARSARMRWSGRVTSHESPVTSFIPDGRMKPVEVSLFLRFWPVASWPVADSRLAP